MPFRFSQDKLDAVVDDDWLVLEKPLRKSMEFLLRERGELGVVDGKSCHERGNWKDAVNVGLWPLAGRGRGTPGGVRTRAPALQGARKSFFDEHVLFGGCVC